MGCGASSQQGTNEVQRVEVNRAETSSTNAAPSSLATVMTVSVVTATSFTQLLVLLTEPEPSKSKVEEVIESACGEQSVASDAIAKLRSVAPSNVMMIASTAFGWMGSVAPPPFNTVLGLMGKVFFAAGVAQHNRRMANYLARRLLSINEPLSDVMSRGDFKNPSATDKLLASRIRDLLEECHQHLSEFVPPSGSEDDNAVIEWAKVKLKEITTSQESWEDIHNKIDQLLRDITFDHVAKGRVEAAEMARMIKDDSEEIKGMLRGMKVEIEKLTGETEKLASLTAQMLKQREFEDMLIQPTQVKLVKPIGQGGQGVIWEALLDNKPTVVAKKVNDTNSAQAAASLREAKMLMNFRHPNIVQCFGVCIKSGDTYILLERCIESLDGIVVSTSPLPIGAAICAVYDVCCGLSHVHSRHRVHRDVKIDNAMIKSTGDLCIIDFGSMKSEMPKATMHTTMALSGLQGTTTLYAAPELLSDPTFTATAACDVYSFGMLLYEMLHGCRAFEKESKRMSQAKLMAGIEDGLRPELREDLPSELADLIRRCWSPAPEDRATMDFIKTTLEHLKQKHYPNADAEWRGFLKERWGGSVVMDASSNSMRQVSTTGNSEGTFLSATINTSNSNGAPRSLVYGDAAPVMNATSPLTPNTDSQRLDKCPLSCCARVHELCTRNQQPKVNAEVLCGLFSSALGLTVAPLRLKHFLTLRGKGTDHLDEEHLPQTICDFIFWFVSKMFTDVARSRTSVTCDEVKQIVISLIPSAQEALQDELDMVLEDIISSNGSSSDVTMSQVFDVLDTMFSESLDKAETTDVVTGSGSTPSTVVGVDALVHGFLYEIVPLHDESLRIEKTSMVPSEARDGCGLRFATADGSPAQRVTAYSNTNGTWTFCFQCAPAIVIDNGGGVGIACHGWSRYDYHDNQGWVLVECNAASPTNKTGTRKQGSVFCVGSALDRSCVWEAKSGGGHGAPLWTMPRQGGIGFQQFKFVRIMPSDDALLAAGEVYEINPRHNRKLCLSLPPEAFGAEGTKFRFTDSPNRTPNEQFRAIRNADGSWTFLSMAAPWANIDNGGAPNRGCHLYTTHRNHENQSWTVQPAKDAQGAFVVRSKLDRSSVWSVEEGPQPMLLTNFQSILDLNRQFYFTKAINTTTNSSLVSGAVYEMQPQHNLKLRVVARQGQTSNGNALLLSVGPFKSDENLFTAELRQDGAWRFVSKCGDGNASLDCGGAINRACHLWERMEDNSNQWWYLEPCRNAAGAFFVRSEAFLRGGFDVSGSGGNGAQLLNWELHRGPNQQFRFIRVDAIKSGETKVNSAGNVATLSATTQKFYCGKTLGFSCGCCDNICGPLSGCNCIPCQKLDLERRSVPMGTAVVNREGAICKFGDQGKTKLYCGRDNMKHDLNTNGCCGPNTGNNCKACQTALKTYPSLLGIAELKPGQKVNRDNNVATKSNNGKFYCGKKLDFSCGCCNGFCGPNSGCNCTACNVLDIVERGLQQGTAVVNKEGAACKYGSGNGATKLYCGRNNMGHDRATDGFCGPTNGNNCSACQVALRTYKGKLI